MLNKKQSFTIDRPSYTAGSRTVVYTPSQTVFNFDFFVKDLYLRNDGQSAEIFLDYQYFNDVLNGEIHVIKRDSALYYSTYPIPLQTKVTYTISYDYTLFKSTVTFSYTNMSKTITLPNNLSSLSMNFILLATGWEQ